MNILNIILLVIMLVSVTILIVSVFYPIVLKPNDYHVWRLLKNDSLVMREHYDYINDDSSLIKEVWIADFVEHPDYYAFCYSEKFSTEIKLGVFRNSDSSLSITSFYKAPASEIIKKVLIAYAEYVDSANKESQETDTNKIEEDAE